MSRRECHFYNKVDVINYAYESILFHINVHKQPSQSRLCIRCSTVNMNAVEPISNFCWMQIASCWNLEKMSCVRFGYISKMWVIQNTMTSSFFSWIWCYLGRLLWKHQTFTTQSIFAHQTALQNISRQQQQHQLTMPSKAMMRLECKNGETRKNRHVVLLLLLFTAS